MFVSSCMPYLSILVSYNRPMNITMQCLTHATACFPLVFRFLFHGKYTSHGASLLYHMMFQEVHTSRRKETPWRSERMNIGTPKVRSD